VKEDRGGTNPKFLVRDADGVEWKVKLGLEARSETAASRIVWAAGYATDEDYLVRDMQVGGLPRHLHRGQKLIGPGGTVHNARLEREREGEKKTGSWRWKRNEFAGSREWNGLRVLMALLNNWDLKDVNNAVYDTGSKRIYMVSDLGAGFGSAGRSWPATRAKDNRNSYSRSKLIGGSRQRRWIFRHPRPAIFYPVNLRRISCGFGWRAWDATFLALTRSGGAIAGTPVAPANADARHLAIRRKRSMDFPECWKSVLPCSPTCDGR
jgi:hypothetical protein